jgi:hypothetical protein
MHDVHALMTHAHPSTNKPTTTTQQQDEEEEDEEEVGYAATPVVFTVTVSKGETMMAFKCVGGGDYVRITHIELDDTGEWR